MSFWKRLIGGSAPEERTSLDKEKDSPPNVESPNAKNNKQDEVVIPVPGPPGEKYWSSPNDTTIRPAGSFRLSRDAKAYLKGIGGTVQNTDSCQITRYDETGKVLERIG